MKYRIIADGNIDKTFDNARDADVCKQELTLKGLHPSLVTLIEFEDVNAEIHCLVARSNKCGKTVCCSTCDEQNCDQRCLDDCFKCKYTCSKEEAEKLYNKNNLVFAHSKTEPVKTEPSEESTDVKSTNDVKICDITGETSVADKYIDETNSVENTNKISDKKERNRLIVEDIQNGVPVKDIAQKYGLSVTRIMGIKKSMQ